MSASGGYSCKKCSRRDSADNMVCCDCCDGWEHFECAGVTHSISDTYRSFVCVRCMEEAGANSSNAVPPAAATKERENIVASMSESPNTGAIPKNSTDATAVKVVGSVVSVNTSASSRRSQRKQMCLNLLEETKKVKIRMLEEEEKYLQAKFELLMRFEGEDDEASNKSLVSARSKRKRLEKWLKDGQNISEPVGDPLVQVPPAPEVHAKADGIVVPDKNSAVPTSKTESVLKSLEQVTPIRPSQETSTPLQAGRTTMTDLISPTTILTSPLAGLTQTQQSHVWPLSGGPSRASDFLHSGRKTCTAESRDKVQFHQSAIVTGVVDRSSVSGAMKTTATASVYSQAPLGTVTGPEGAYRASTALAFTSNSTTLQTSTTRAISNQYNQPMSMQNPSGLAHVWNGVSSYNRQPEDCMLPRSSPFPLPRGDPSSILACDPPVSVGNQFCVVSQPVIEQTQVPWSMASHVPSAAFNPVTGSGFSAPPLASGMFSAPNYLPPAPTVGPTGSQMAARQVMPRDLPTFSGDPEDWPIFYSSFRNSTDVCGYNDAENLARLQRCLRGSALEAVRSRLLLPASVPFVIETLRKLYGRPEVLINSLLKKLRNTPSPKADNLHSIVIFGLAVQNLIDHMVISDQQLHLANPMLLQELVEKLPTNLKMQWGYYKSAVPNVNLETFNAFMTGLVNLASELSLNTEISHHSTATRGDKYKEKLFVHAHELPDATDSSAADKKQDHFDNTGTAQGCSYCEITEHQISNCTKFKELTVDERWKAIRRKNLCRTCLIPHRKWPCRSSKECGKEGCRIRHHPLLHTDPVTASTNSRVEHQNHHFNESLALFRYLPVTIFGNGRQVNIFAFLDEGSSSTLLESSIADKLGVDGPVSSLWLSWTGNITREEKESRCVEVTISGSGQKKKFAIGNVQTVDDLQLPKQSFDYESLVQQFPYLRGLPLESYSEATPRMIIGLEHVRLLTTLKLREGGDTGPVAVKTRLGWCAYGKGLNNANYKMQQLNFHYSEVVTNQTIHDLMKRFFEAEESIVIRKLEADDDRRALEILEGTTVRKEDRFETGLLWRTDVLSFPDSLPMATKRLLSLEKRLTRNPELGRKVKEQIASYEAKQYAHKASKEELDQADPQRVWYLPLGVVTNERKPGKIRLIWDAAAKAGGVSFNDFLLKGPDLLTSLPDVLLRFRERNVAICGDICEMFHQIRIREQDKQSQRFLWRNNPGEPIQTYIMDVSTFGATCSPCSAQFIKNKNAREFSEVYPRAVDAIIYNHYVDDFLDCTDTEEEATELVQNVKTIHAAAGFEISKFRSNSGEVLSALGESGGCHNKQLCSDKQITSERVLGLTWIPNSDVFTFDTTALLPRTIQPGSDVPTKRQVLQTVMKLFDPLGLISHYIVHGKILMQDIWRSGTNWDEPIEDHLLDQWHRWTELLGLLSEVQVPRCFFKGQHSNSLQGLQLHVLVDASEASYACVAYLRLNTENGGRCVLVASKTKVAPLKPLSVPRLELQAALIGARLSQNIVSALTLKIQKCYYWSDSSTVLSWLRSDARRYHQYVAFRVGEILSITNVDDWRYVPSKLNVADEATKWGHGPSFHPESRWFRGPSFLWESEVYWPTEEKHLSTTREELRTTFQHHNCTVKDPLIDTSRFSNWNRMVRAMAYVHRAVEIWRKRLVKEQRNTVLRSDDLLKAENTIWKETQGQAFSGETLILKEKAAVCTIPKRSPLFQLSPFLDEQQVIRLRSRIEAAPYTPYEAKYPIILPTKHRVTFLLVDSYHRRFLHANNETVCNEIRQRYHIPKLRSLIKSVSKTCQACKVSKALPKPPIMAPLPRVRLTPFIQAFTFVGVDFFGPLEVKVGRGVAKRWVALFTCLTVRAVHLELTHSLSTQSCIMAIRRFVARRGAPKEVYTDNGTNFHGAGRRLNEEKKILLGISEKCATTFTNANTTWHYNVPAAPHMGGPWERMVRAVKTAMKAITEYPRHANDEVLETVLLEAESVVNSRPLTYIPVGDVNQESLTPNHFLLYGSSGVKHPAGAPVEGRFGLRHSWTIAQDMVNGFWHRWVLEYMPMLTRRTKWFEKVKPLEPGDLVIVIDENARNSWERGRILEVIKGRDGQVRRATVQTLRGVYSRPAVKLAVLDVNGAEEETAADRAGYGSFHGRGDVATLSGRNEEVEMTPNTVDQRDMCHRQTDRPGARKIQ